MAQRARVRGIQRRIGRDGDVRYRVQVRRKGHPPVCRTFARLADALAFQAKVETTVNEGGALPGQEARRRTVGDAIDRYIEAVIEQRSDHSAKGHLRFWRGRLGSLRIGSVTADHVAAGRDHLSAQKTRLGRPMAPATVKLHLETLSAMFKYARRELRWCTHNPCADVRRPRPAEGRVRFLLDHERAALLEATAASPEKRLHPLVVLALSTGARAGELLNLKWRDVDLERGVAVLHKTKNGERRALSIKGGARTLLKAMHSDDQDLDEHVFGNPVNPIFDYRQSWLAAKEAAGVQDFRFHDLRHSAASYLAMDGASTSEIAAVLGHKTLAMVKRYAHLSDSHVATVVERMNRRIFGDAEKKAT